MQGTVLVIDDDEGVRVSVRRLVAHLGFDAVEADGMHEAMAALERVPSLVAAVIDVTMPKFSEPEVAARLRERQPGLAILYMSGYDEADALAGLTDRTRHAFLQKPFTVEGLERALQALVGS